MALTARNTRLAAIVIGTAVAGSLAPAASAASDREQLYVNPSTGFATPAPPADQTVRVDPSTGYASVREQSASDAGAVSRATQPAAAAPASSGFDWTAAGIGAAIGGGLVLVLMLSLATLGVGGLSRAPRVS
jgi:hypothetical protein